MRSTSHLQSTPSSKGFGFTILESLIVLGLLVVLTMVLIALWKHHQGAGGLPGKQEPGGTAPAEVVR